MKLGLGIMSCERFDFLFETIESLYQFNPELKKFPLIIGDDASSDIDCRKMKACWPWATILHAETREGCSRNINKIYKYAEAIGLDLLYFSVNDYACTREIDFNALVKFFEETPEAGQVQFVYWKARINDEKQARAAFNWTTREKTKVVSRLHVGDEFLWEGNWSFVNLPAITRLNEVDICKGTIGMEGSGDKFAQKVELMWVKNWYDHGLKNYQTDAYKQPFLSLDIDINKRTPGLKV